MDFNDTLKLVDDYINGVEMDDDLITELENNPIFMLRVIFQSNDKKMYNFCSDSVKEDFQFVKNIIIKFRDDEKFIMAVADTFLEKSKDEAEQVEIYMLLEDFLKDPMDKVGYIIMCKAFFVGEIVKHIAAVNSLGNSKDLGLGFVFVKEKYQNHPKIIDRFVEHYLNDLFYSNDKDVEIFLHEHFDKKETLEEYGVTKYITEFITFNDSYLSSYVQVNSHLISDVLKEAHEAINNWDEYEYKLNTVRAEVIYDYAENYVYEHNNIRFVSGEAVRYIVNNSPFKAVFDRYDQDYLEKYNLDIKYEDVISDYIAPNFTFEEQRFIDDLRKYIVKVFGIKNLKELDKGDYREEDGEVINVNFSSNGLK